MESLVILTGYNRRATGSVLPIAHPRQIIFFILLAAVLYALFRGTDLLLNRIITEKEQHPAKRVPKEKTLFWSFFGALLLLWLPYWIPIFPGGAWYDTGAQITQFMGVEPITKANPLLQTALAGGFFRLGVLLGKAEIGVGLYVALQAIISALVMAYGAVTLYKNNQNLKITAVLLFFFGINPTVPIYIWNIGKDTNFGIMILLAVICLANIYREGRLTKADRILFPLSLVLMALLRNAGIFLAVTFGTAAIFAAQKEAPKDQKEKQKRITARGLIAILSAASIAIALLFEVSTDALLHVNKKVNETENLSIPLLQMAGYITAYPDELTEEEKAILDKVINVDEVPAVYNPDISDPLKDAYAGKSPTAEDMKAFWSLYFRFLSRHPLKFLEVLIAKSYGYFDPFTGRIDKPFTCYGFGQIGGRIEGMLGIQLHSATDDLSAIMNYVSDLENIPVVQLLTRCGFYMALLLYFIFASIRYRVNRWIILPMAAFAAGLVATPVNAYFRYNIPLVFCAPFLILMVYVTERERRNRKPEEEIQTV